MGLPQSLKKQVEAANKLHAEVYKAEEQEAEAEKQETEQEQSAETQAEAQERPAPQPSPRASSEDDGKDYRQMYKVIKGKYDAEVPRLHENVRSLQETVRGLETALAAMQRAAPAKAEPSEPPQPQAKSRRLVTEEEIDDYGDDMIDVVKRAAQEAMMPYIEKLEQENTQLKQQLGGVTGSIQQSARARMYATLTEEVPEWKDLNQDPEFLEWLRQSDPYSGNIRHELLTRAFERNDTARVAAFFRGYLNENAVVSPASPRRQSSAKVDLNTLVSPGRSREATNPRAQEGNKRLWTQAQISKFYADSAAGRYRGREKEKAALEREIIQAANERRIVG